MNIRSKCFKCIIEKNDIDNNRVVTDNLLKDYLEKEDNIEFYSFILHDKDVNEIGELIRPHYHLVIYLNNDVSKNTIIVDIAKHLMISKDIVSVRVGEIVKSVQYLIHDEKYDKFIYSISDIYTNDLDNLLLILNSGISPFDLNINYLINIVDMYKTRSEIYKVIGLKNSRLYRNVINDLINERFMK